MQSEPGDLTSAIDSLASQIELMRVEFHNQLAIIKAQLNDKPSRHREHTPLPRHPATLAGEVITP